jgi:putative transposase
MGAHTYIRIYVHIVFSTKRREAYLASPEIRTRLWAYINGIAKHNGYPAIITNGHVDHCHTLLELPSTVMISKAVQKIKGVSSKWLSETYPELKSFEWQEGYGAFSVSTSQVKRVVDYIERQEDHHRHKSFQEEYIAFLKANNIPYDERYVLG